jgi:hypothetical protein
LKTSTVTIITNNNSPRWFVRRTRRVRSGARRITRCHYVIGHRFLVDWNKSVAYCARHRMRYTSILRVRQLTNRFRARPDNGFQFSKLTERARSYISCVYVYTSYRRVPRAVFVVQYYIDCARRRLRPGKLPLLTTGAPVIFRVSIFITRDYCCIIFSA